MSQTHSLTHLLTGGVLALLAISTLSVDRFARSLRFCHVEYDEEGIYYGFMANSRVLQIKSLKVGKYLNLNFYSDFFYMKSIVTPNLLIFVCPSV